MVWLPNCLKSICNSRSHRNKRSLALNSTKEFKPMQNPTMLIMIYFNFFFFFGVDSTLVCTHAFTFYFKIEDIWFALCSLTYNGIKNLSNVSTVLIITCYICIIAYYNISPQKFFNYFINFRIWKISSNLRDNNCSSQKHLHTFPFYWTIFWGQIPRNK